MPHSALAPVSCTRVELVRSSPTVCHTGKSQTLLRQVCSKLSLNAKRWVKQLYIIPAAQVTLNSSLFLRNNISQQERSLEEQFLNLP